MVLPNFLYVGADKAGSTWLYKALRQHPEVFVPAAKDLYFFDREFDRGIDWYASFFAGAPPAASRLGEICHDYLHAPAAPERIAATLPGVTILIALREPFDRTRSAYLHSKKVGATDLPFAEALERHPWMHRRSRYAESVARYLDHFGRERVRVLFFDDLARDPGAYFDQVCDALDVSRLAPETIDLSAEQVARAPRSSTLTRAAKQAAVALRRRGHPDLVGRLKHARLLQWALYAPGSADAPVSAEDERRWRLAFADDVAALSALLDEDLGRRWGYPMPGLARAGARPAVAAALDPRAQPA